MAKIIYYLGILAAIWCVVDIIKQGSWGFFKKLIVAILVLATSWIGFAAYYFILRKKL